MISICEAARRNALFNDLSPAAKAAAAGVLDDISRPMTAAEIDRSLAGILPRKSRRQLIAALRGVAILTVHQDECE